MPVPASLEYGAANLSVPLIMVLGHSHCGAVAAAIKVVKDQAKLPGHLPELVEEIKPAVMAAQAQHLADLLAASIIENVRRNVRRLIAAKPIIAAKVQAGKVKVAGGAYDLATGKVALVLETAALPPRLRRAHLRKILRHQARKSGP